MFNLMRIMMSNCIFTVLNSASGTVAAESWDASAIKAPSSHAIVRAGQDFDILWVPTAEVNSIDLVLMSGPSYDSKEEYTIAENVPNSGSHTWNVPDATHSKEFAIMIRESFNNMIVNYSPFFVLVGNIAETDAPLATVTPAHASASFLPSTTTQFDTASVASSSPTPTALNSVAAAKHHKEHIRIHINEHSRSDHATQAVVRSPELAETSTQIDRHLGNVNVTSTCSTIKTKSVPTSMTETSKGMGKNDGASLTKNRRALFSTFISIIVVAFVI